MQLMLSSLSNSSGNGNGMGIKQNYPIKKIHCQRKLMSTNKINAISKGNHNERSIATKLLHPEHKIKDAYKAVSPPLYQTATYDQPSATEMGPYDYTRSGNPTRTMLEDHIAEIEGGSKAFAFASGMAALSTVCRLVNSDEFILAGDDLYNGTDRLLNRILPSLNIKSIQIDTTDLKKIEESFKTYNVKMVFLESPTNPRLQVCDIRKICKMAKEYKAIICVDNSILTPVYCKPLELGADISMTSATKFIGGHSDVTAGLLAVKDTLLAEKLYFIQNAEGAILGPFDCWLCMRGLKTMALRMERQVHNCQKIFEFLKKSDVVKDLYYPGSSSDVGFELNQKQAKSGGSIISFTTGNVDISSVICKETELFAVTVSFGSVISSISMPCFMSHATMPAEVKKERGLVDDLIRISAGIEDVNDLICDLDQAIQKAKAVYDSRSKIISK